MNPGQPSARPPVALPGADLRQRQLDRINRAPPNTTPGDSRPGGGL
jgi:hypothetical protein